MRKVALLGATGSIGTSVLKVIRAHPDRFSVAALAARRGGEQLAALAREFPNAAIAFHNADDAETFGRSGDRVLSGPDAALRLMREVNADICVAAVAGTAGLNATFAAAERGMRVLLANKEVLVSAGRLFLDVAGRSGAEILPLDSEHSALFQCLAGSPPEKVDKLVVTASGGPFRTWSESAIATATAADALRHPVWRMGDKITIDSASLANKALEVIEAHHLFGMPFDKIEVLIHPESVIHGLVQFVDGSLLAHMCAADMCHPAAYGLFYPEREKNSLRRLNLAEIGQLTFDKPDFRRFPLLEMGIAAGRRGEQSAAAFNSANEAAVDLFLSGRIGFADMAKAVEYGLRDAGDAPFSSLGEVEEVHRGARALVAEWAAQRGG